MPLVAREYEGGWNKFSSCMGIILRARLGGVFALSYKTVKHNALASLQLIASDLDMTWGDRKHLAFRSTTLRLQGPQRCLFLRSSVAACVPPFLHSSSLATPERDCTMSSGSAAQMAAADTFPRAMAHLRPARWNMGTSSSETWRIKCFCDSVVPEIFPWHRLGSYC